MNEQYKYYAFISYKREDEKWAKWLQNKLMHYRLPVAVRRNNPELPKRVHPVFRDVTDLGGDAKLKESIEHALNESKYLIVICSPHAANSEWVCKEVQHFIETGREDYIIPFIVDGTPFSNNDNECFPEALRGLTGERELLGINIKENGLDSAVVKVVARMFSIDYDILWDRYRRVRRQQKILKYSIIIGFVVLCLTILGLYIRSFNQEVNKYCTSGIKPDDGFYVTTQKLLKYHNLSWLLTTENEELVEFTLFNYDNLYKMNSYPILFSYRGESARRCDHLSFNSSGSKLCVSGFNETTLLDLKHACSEQTIDKRYVLYADSAGNLVSYLTELSLFSEQGNKIKGIEGDWRKLIPDMRNRTLACTMPTGDGLTDVRKIAVYDHNLNIILEKQFADDIYAFSYNRDGTMIAVSTIDSILTIIDVQSGKTIRQRHEPSVILSIQPANNANDFYVLHFGDSLRLSKTLVGDISADTTLMNLPYGDIRKCKIAHTCGNYVAVTNGSQLFCYNTSTNQFQGADLKRIYNGSVDNLVMSPTGTLIAYSINDNVFIMEMKDSIDIEFHPYHIYSKDINCIIGASSVSVVDSTITLSLVKDGCSSLNTYELYSGEKLYTGRAIAGFVDNLVALPNSPLVAKPDYSRDCWEVISLEDSTFSYLLKEKDFTSSSKLYLASNRKLLVGVSSPFDVTVCIPRYAWNCKDLQLAIEPNICLYPLMAGEHYSYLDTLYSIDDNLPCYYSEQYPFGFNGEIYDSCYGAYAHWSNLTFFDLKSGDSRQINIERHLKGNKQMSQVIAYQKGLVVVTDGVSIYVIDEETGRLLLRRDTTQY